MVDRKYKQRGYMDSEPREERKPAPQGPRERPEGPRGRGLGAPTATTFRCRVCGSKQQLSGLLPIDATCFDCNNDLHTCSNCVYFDGARPNECRRPVLQRVAAKGKRNSCDLFAPNTIQEFASEQVAAGPSPRAAFDALFNKK